MGLFCHRVYPGGRGVLRFGSVLILVIGFCFSFSSVGSEEEGDQLVAAVDKQVSRMTVSLRNVYKEVAEAKKKNDILLINCLMTKLNLLKGLLRASQRAKIVLMEAYFGGDMDTAKLYRGKVESYATSAKEIEDSLPECRGKEALKEGTRLVYLRPADERPVFVDPWTPWDWSRTPGESGFPVVPPASPFR